MTAEHALKPGLPELPRCMKSLPIDGRGYPVPKFVAMVDGKWDFRVVEPRWLVQCVTYKKCWLCGEKLGSNFAFVVGPMCVVNRATGEPPCHLECARFAVAACPFMLRPRMKRNEKDLPDGTTFHDSGIKRNPGVYALYVTRKYDWLARQNIGRMGPPTSVEWYKEGRAATRAEVEDGFSAGLPTLKEAAEKDGGRALYDLAVMVEHAAALWPVS